ncbi:TPA: hypothetical protein KO123_002314 [Clostridioides difficile]|nr:hypothetical protein [Clostridioides difficile]
MNLWFKIEEPVMRAISGIVFNIWGSVCFSMEYIEKNKQIELEIYDRPYRYEGKKIVAKKLFDYKLINADYKEIHDIVSMIEKFLLENY